MFRKWNDIPVVGEKLTWYHNETKWDLIYQPTMSPVKTTVYPCESNH